MVKRVGLLCSFRFFVSVVSLLCSLAIVATDGLAEDPISRTTDFDGDGLGDLFYFNPTSKVFSFRGSSTGGFAEASLGSVGDIPSVGDFDGDGRADIATFNRSTVEWNISLNSDKDIEVPFGNIGDIPVPGFYTTTSCTDLATYNPRTTRWMIRNCRDNKIRQFFIGSRGSVPAPADYDCDGKTDAAVFDRTTRRWTVKRSSDEKYVGFYFGLFFDIPVPADFLGKNCAQPAVYRPTSKHFFIADSFASDSEANLNKIVQWGLEGDLHGLYNVDGDNKADYTVLRPENSTFFLRTSNDTFFSIPFVVPPEARLEPPFNNEAPQAQPGTVPVQATSLQSPSYPVKGDYDGDRRSDFAYARVERNFYRTLWYVRHQDETETLLVVNAPGDALVPGDYNGDGKTQPAVVYVNPGLPQEGNLEWHISNPDGTELIRHWGKNGDRPIAGDFDCDGKDDVVIAREELGGVFWFMWFSSPLSEAVGDYLFGLAGDKTYAADMTGDGCDELIVSRKVGNNIHWFYQSLGETTYTEIPWGSTSDVLLPPSDFDGDGKADLMFSRANNQDGVDTYIKRSAEGDITIPFGLHGDVALTGNFSGGNMNELAVYRGSEEAYYIRKANGLVALVPFGSADEFLVRPDGSVVPPREGNIGRYKSGGCDESLTFVDGPGGSLWKPVSDNTHNPVFLLPPEYWDSPTMGASHIEVLSSTGDLILNARRRTCCPNGGRAHWDVDMRASSLNQFAPITVKLYLNNGTTECREVPIPTQRYD